MSNTKENTSVAVVGLGNIGRAIASNLAKGNHAVILASRQEEESKALARELGENATAASIADAIKAAKVVIPAIPFGSLKDFFTENADALEGKIVIDVSNAIAPDGQGGFKKIIGETESAAGILSSYVPKTAKLVKAFGTLGAASLSGEAFAKPERKVLFFASDSTNSNTVVEELITDSGFAPLHIGGLDNAQRIEVFGDLHQYGALGRVVTLSEAKSLLQ